MTNFQAYGKNPTTGRQIIKVDHVSKAQFEENPNIIWNYDVMMHGTWDSNASELISDSGINIIESYIKAGKGVLTGHDTIGAITGTKKGFGKIREYFKIKTGNYGGAWLANGYDINASWGYMSNKVKITKKGFLTQFPWSLGPVGTVLRVPESHTAVNVATGNTWMEYVDTEAYDRLGLAYLKKENFENAPKTPEYNYKYYLTTWNNTAMIQTGHSMGQSTEDERKVLANTLFYLKQLTHKTEILDNSARDIADPNKPENIVYKVDEQGNNIIEFRKPQDNRKYI